MSGKNNKLKDMLHSKDKEMNRLGVTMLRNLTSREQLFFMKYMYSPRFLKLGTATQSFRDYAWQMLGEGILDCDLTKKHGIRRAN